MYVPCILCRSQWRRGLRRRSSAARLLRLWVRIPPGAWKFVCCECCVLSCRGFCEGLITPPEESYRLWRVVVCDQETSKPRRLKSATGLGKYNNNGLQLQENKQQTAVHLVATVYCPDQQMHNTHTHTHTHIYIYIHMYSIYRKHYYMFRCIRIIFRESYPITLLNIQKSLSPLITFRWPCILHINSLQYIQLYDSPNCIYSYMTVQTVYTAIWQSKLHIEVYDSPNSIYSYMTVQTVYRGIWQSKQYIQLYDSPNFI